ncbi:hypothetical protein PUN28_000058 [Cardiocondyla obscurior]|uniref:Secreted protein n=1 Tax=Cardiocondyla obscurior TaxID=286306 RepID=A0AAW2GXL7_9HYME
MIFMSTIICFILCYSHRLKSTTPLMLMQIGKMHERNNYLFLHEPSITFANSIASVTYFRQSEFICGDL